MSNPKANFIEALNVLHDRAVVVRAISSLWHSPAWPAGKGSPDYINAVAEVSTKLSSEMLLECLHEVEAIFGRTRKVINAPRPMDLDVIDYRGEVKSGTINLPHPRLMGRPFVLLPLLEVAPSWTHPVTKLSAANGLAQLDSKDVLAHYVIERNWLKSLACV